MFKNFKKIGAAYMANLDNGAQVALELNNDRTSVEVAVVGATIEVAKNLGFSPQGIDQEWSVKGVSLQDAPKIIAAVSAV